MLKNLLIATAIIAATSTVAFAAQGPYVGANVGVNNSAFKVNDTASYTHNIGANGAVAGVFGGYGAMVNPNVYLGAEAFLNASNNEAKNIVNGNNLNLKTRYSYGLRFVPGMAVTEKTMAYGVLGVVRTRFEAAQSNATTFKTDKTTVTGGQIGAGIQTDLTQNLALRGEYVYTNYRSFNTTMIRNIKPASGQATLGLVYKFE